MIMAVSNSGSLKKIKYVIPAVILCAVIAVCFAFLGNKEKTTSFFAMDTYCSAKVKGKNSSECLKQIEAAVTDLENVISRHKESSVFYAINREVKGSLDKKQSEWLNAMLSVSKNSGGAFDFTLGELSDLWGFGNNPKVPEEKDIKKILSKTGCEKINLTKNRISFPEGVSVDMGAVGKGIALDEIKTLLDETKTDSAVISIGGSILLYGDDTLTVGITDPAGKSQYIGILTPGKGCVSTSGSYERFFEENGKKYHHILNPETGYPADSGLVSVTVYSENGLLSDALSTACFVLGKEKGTALLKEYGCGGIFVETDGGVTVTDDLSGKFRLTDTSYTMR